MAQNRTPPEGALTLFAGTDVAANFIVEGSARRDGDQVNVTTFRVYANGIPGPAGPIMYDTTFMTIDCAARTFRRLRVDGFLASGRYFGSLGAEPEVPIEAHQTWDFVAKSVCDGVRFGPDATVVGYRAARDLALARMKP
jgi:hypothetical protein